MRSTEDDIFPLGSGGRLSPVAVAKVAAKVLAVIIPAVLAAITAYRSAAGEAKEAVAAASARTKAQGQRTKNEAEAAYQFTKAWAENVEARLAAVEKRQIPEAGKKGKRRPPAPVRLKALPADLATAERQLRLVTPAPVPGAALAPMTTGTHMDASP